MAFNPEPIFVEWPVVCRSCHAKQTVHLDARTGPALWSAQSIKCVKCGIGFDVIFPHRIINGPFEQTD